MGKTQRTCSFTDLPRWVDVLVAVVEGVEADLEVVARTGSGADFVEVGEEVEGCVVVAAFFAAMWSSTWCQAVSS